MSGAFPDQGRIAGVDYGDVRIGVAVTDRERRLASPLANYTRRGREADAAWFRRLVQDHELVGFVIGLPVRGGGEQSAKSLDARRFGRWLAEVTGLPVRFFDERYTTVEAEEALRTAGMTHKRRKARRDMLAAQIMLSAFLESSLPDRPPGSLD